MSFLRIQNLYKTFDRVVAVNHIDLEIAEGEFFTLLGSSGCGKTTTLRMVGGLEKPDGGEIHLGGQCLVSSEKKLFIKPEKRDMGMVFQSYALWPHMTVFENVVYPLKLRGIKGRDAEKKVADVLGLVGLAGLEERPAPALSGGQQQRVALARALVFSPKVLLLDEPLSNLDAQLREEMRRELKSLQQRVNITVIFVTHDQIEALSLSDRIAIMKFGVLEQVGTPEQVYYHPATPFVRDFLGKTFLLPGKISGRCSAGRSWCCRRLRPRCRYSRTRPRARRRRAWRPLRPRRWDGCALSRHRSCSALTSAQRISAQAACSPSTRAMPVYIAMLRIMRLSVTSSSSRSPGTTICENWALSILTR